MTATPTILARTKFLNRPANLLSIAFDAAYPTGGEAISLAQMGLRALHEVFVQSRDGYLVEYDHTNKKFKVLLPTSTSAATTTAMRLSHGGGDIKGSANTDSENADAGALPTNGALVGALTAVAAGAYAFPATAHPDTGRNVAIVVYNDSGGALNLFEGVMTFTVTGTWRGAAQTDTITFTSTAGNKAIANTKYRYKYGLKPFDTVTAVTVDNICDNGLKIGVGIGSKVGLPSDLATPESADVLKITKNAAHYSNLLGITDTTNMTVNLGTLADGDDFNIVYAVKSPVTAVASAVGVEVANGTDLSALTIRVLAVGL